MKSAQKLPLDRANISAPAPPGNPQTGNNPSRNAGQRALLSANFAAPLQNGTRAAGSLGRNILSAGDKLRDLIIPESLASVVTGAMWSTGLDRVGMVWGGGEKGAGDDAGRRAEKAREELDDLLAGACPLCENVVAGLDKPFVKEGEDDVSWQV